MWPARTNKAVKSRQPHYQNSTISYSNLQQEKTYPYVLPRKIVASTLTGLENYVTKIEDNGVKDQEKLRKISEN